MTIFAKQKRSLTISVYLTSLALSIYRIFVIRNNLDPTIDDANYYLQDTVQTYFFSALSIFVLILFLFVAIFLGRKVKNNLVNGEPSIIFSSSLSGFIFLGCAFFYIIYFTDNSPELTVLSFCVIFFGIISSIYFLMNASKKADTYCLPIAWLSLAPISFYAFRLLNDFIKQSTTPEASSTHFLLISIIAFLLFFLAEGKFKSGTGNITLYMFFGFSAILFSLIYSLPTIILTAFWFLPTSYTMLYSVIDLSLALYIATRICHLKCPDCMTEDNNDLEKQS